MLGRIQIFWHLISINRCSDELDFALSRVRILARLRTRLRRGRRVTTTAGSCARENVTRLRTTLLRAGEWQMDEECVTCDH